MKNDPIFALTSQDEKKQLVINQVRGILQTKNLANQRLLIHSIAEELDITVLDCAAAFAFLSEENFSKALASFDKISRRDSEKQGAHERPDNIKVSIRLVRYRLNVGFHHNVTEDIIKKVLVEESGVDINNIVNVKLQNLYALVDLPDEMPQEIFHHLKVVEINGQRLDIRRVKPRKKNNKRKHWQIRSAEFISSNQKVKEISN